MMPTVVKDDQAKPLIIALSGGVGGAKFANGLLRTADDSEVRIVANVGDDFEHLGLSISPDIDTLLYTLSGENDFERGWGRRGETWAFMDALRQLGGDGWFQLGDKDLALHVMRTMALRQGESLTQVTRELARAFCITAQIVPASDAAARTSIETEEGTLDFQTYFVRRKCEPKVRRITYSDAQPAPGFLDALAARNLSGVVICPSNPFLSIEPILALRGVRAALKRVDAPVVAVSPLVAGKAVKGPTTKVMSELGIEVSSLAIARLYADLIEGIVIDVRDAHLAPAIRGLGLSVCVVDTLMTCVSDQERLAREVKAFVGAVSNSAGVERATR